MLVDGKYHVGSLVAVFLALGLGVLIGATAFKDDTLVSKQEEIITSLEQQFAELDLQRKSLQEQVASLQARNDQYATFVQQAREFFIANQLKGRSIAIVVAGPELGKGEDELVQLIEDAGGEVSGMWYPTDVWISEAWPYREEAIAATEEWGWPPEPITRRLGLGLARQIVFGPQEDVINRLQDWQMVDVRRLTGRASDTVIFLGGQRAWEGSNLRMQTTIIDGVDELGAKVVAVNRDGWTSLPPQLQQRDIPAIDELGEQVGQVRLVQALGRSHRSNAHQAGDAS